LTILTKCKFRKHR